MALLFYTGQRRSDVIRMGPQHVRNGAIFVRQRKTGAPHQITSITGRSLQEVERYTKAANQKRPAAAAAVRLTKPDQNGHSKRTGLRAATR